MKNKISFWNLLCIWFVCSLAMGLVNSFFIKLPILHNIILSTLGLVLLIYPVYPIGLPAAWSDKQCKLFIRILAVIEIVLSFATKISF